MRYRNPRNGVELYRTLDHADTRQAERQASEWARELAESGACDPERTTWAEAFDEYCTQRLAGLRPTSRLKSIQHLTVFASAQSPQVLADISPQVLSKHVEWLRTNPVKSGNGTKPRSETTIDGHVTSIHAFLKWCHQTGRIPKLVSRPTIPRSRARTSRMKGRPLTDAEFARLVKAVPVVIKREPGQWEILLRGLWHSGLRLGEALNLTWDQSSGFSLDFSRRRPMYLIEADSEKGFRDRLLPVAPEFATFLDAFPDEQRTGKVFKLHNVRLGSMEWIVQSVSRVISRIGREAKIVVSRGGKFASAHDLRRTFGLRWSERIPPKDLMVLMRHEDITTTMAYYVGQDADRTAEVIWRGDNWGTNPVTSLEDNSGDLTR